MSDINEREYDAEVADLNNAIRELEKLNVSLGRLVYTLTRDRNKFVVESEKLRTALEKSCEWISNDGCGCEDCYDETDKDYWIARFMEQK